jgi:bifunctional non-homologous end joining protein LigD
MLARPGRTPFDAADHLFEPRWGGERLLAAVAPGRPARLHDARGRDLAPNLPELADLGTSVGAASALLDGELVVADAAGRADPVALAARIAGMAGPAAAYLVFDILDLDGRPLLALPLERRRELLLATVASGPGATPAGSLVVVPAIAGAGIDLHRAATAQGLHGIVGRHRRGPYLPGVRSRTWRFVPCDPPDGVAESADEVADDAAGVPGDAGRGAPDDLAAALPVRPIIAVFERLPLGD